MNLKKVAALSALTFAFVLGLILFSNSKAAAAGTNRYVAPGGLDSGDCSSSASPCATIRFAVMQSQPGDTVNVAAGAYSEGNQAIVVDKSLTLRGPNALISPNMGTRASEAVITTLGSDVSPNTAVEIVDTALNVTIEGLEFSTPASPMTSYSAGKNLTIRKNIFTNLGLGTYYEDPQLVFTDNLLEGATDEDTVQVGGHFPATTHTVSFTNNVWRNVTGSGALNLSNVTGVISGNSFTDVQYYGVLLANGSGNVTISSNVFQRITNPFPLVSATWGSGVRFFDAAFVAPVNVTANCFKDSYIGVGVRAGSDVSGAHVNGNSFTGNNEGVRNVGTGILDATYNWWGAANGPGPVGPGSGDKVSTNVNFTPWLTSPAPTACNVATTKDQCKNNGWQAHLRANGTAFKNQGDCIQYVNTGK
jgi:nitrous oxidase accessory protein NosD